MRETTKLEIAEQTAAVRFVKALKDDGRVWLLFEATEDTNAPGHFRKGETFWKELDSFDWAMPQPWFDSVLDKTGRNPAGQVVWCYDDSIVELRYAGEPLAVTDEGRTILAEHRRKGGKP